MLEIKNASFIEERESGRFEYLEDTELSCLGVLGMAVWVYFVYCPVSVLYPLPLKETETWGKCFYKTNYI